MSERETLATALQRLAWAEARRQGRTEAASPWESGLTQEQRREAWLATLGVLGDIQVEIARLAESAETRAVEHGADEADLTRATGVARRRWPRLSALFRSGLTGPRAGSVRGSLSAQGRATTARYHLPPGL